MLQENFGCNKIVVYLLAVSTVTLEPKLMIIFVQFMSLLKYRITIFIIPYPFIQRMLAYYNLYNILYIALQNYTFISYGICAGFCGR